MFSLITSCAQYLISSASLKIKQNSYWKSLGSFAFAICLIGEILDLSRSSFLCFLLLFVSFHKSISHRNPQFWHYTLIFFSPRLSALSFVCEFDLELSCSCSAFLTSCFLQNHWQCLSWSHSKHLHTFIVSNASLVRSKITVSSSFFYFLSPEKLWLITCPEFLVSLCPGKCLGSRSLPATVMNLSMPLSQSYSTSNTGL